MNRKYVASVLSAGALWGFMGFFRRTLDGMGISAIGCIAVRCSFAAVMFAAVMLIRGGGCFRIRLRDAWCFIGCGLLSLLVFGLCYFKAMDYMSLSNAAILLYTAPCFVILMSAPLFKERVTVRKLAAMLIAFLGCAFVSGLGSGAGGRISLIGLLLGLGAGFCYALYSIFTRFCLERGYSPLTVNFYACCLAVIGATLIGGTDYIAPVTASAGNLLFAAATGLITCFMPYLLYTYGLTGLENGKASVMASTEPVVATAVGIAVYSEPLTWLNALGVVLVLSAIVMLNIEKPVRSDK